MVGMRSVNGMSDHEGKASVLPPLPEEFTLLPGLGPQPPEGLIPEPGNATRQDNSRRSKAETTKVASDHALDSELLLADRRREPAWGWRRAVYRLSRGRVIPRESAAELRERELLGRASTRVRGGHHRVAVLSLKGGVGKTTTTIGLGATLASVRGDRIVALDANPDRGTLGDRLRLETTATVRDLLNERDTIERYTDVRAFTSQAPSRLEVLAADRDPAVSEAFGAEDYQQVADILGRFYTVSLTDCGTGLLHSAMTSVLDLANQIVLISSCSVDGARSATATLDWLRAHEHAALADHAVVVLSAVHSHPTVDLPLLSEHFAKQSAATSVIYVPFDPHLAEGAEVLLADLAAPTRLAYLELAAAVADRFA